MLSARLRYLIATLVLSPAAALRHGNHIFNSIHSSMRQWGSSVNHNGMSFYLTTVPAGTQLYHGRHNKKAVVGPEWLAFEPEHALSFARYFSPPPEESGTSSTHSTRIQSMERLARQQQIPLGETRRCNGTAPMPPDFSRGWLHTFATKRELRFLYIDGMSAAKSNRGTLDTQDYVLLHDVDLTGPIDGDGERAQALCRMLAAELGSRVAGAIRMEAGFEIIMCDMADVDLVRCTEVEQISRGSHGGSSFLLTYLRNIAARYHGIGSHRVELDYGSLTTAYSLPLDMPSANNQRRLKDWPKEALQRLRADVITSALDALDHGSRDQTNWQAVADMIVARYASWLPSLLLPHVAGEADLLLHELHEILRPFVDRAMRNASLETRRCSQQFLPPSYGNSLASQAVVYTAEVICSNVSTAAKVLESAMGSADEEDARLDVLTRIQRLVEYLQWPVWKECRGCGYDELCMVAIWPWGSVQDHERPSCANASGLAERWGYWISEPPRSPG